MRNWPSPSFDRHVCRSVEEKDKTTLKLSHIYIYYISLPLVWKSKLISPLLPQSTSLSGTERAPCQRPRGQTGLSRGRSTGNRLGERETQARNAKDSHRERDPARNLLHARGWLLAVAPDTHHDWTHAVQPNRFLQQRARPAPEQDAQPSYCDW